MAKFHCIFVLGAIAAIGVVTAVTDDETNNIKAAMIKVISECSDELGIKKEDVLAAKQAKNPDALDSCFYACIFKKIGTINDQGEYDSTVSKELHKKYLSDEDDLAKVDAVSDYCTSINSETVTDGAKGCERSRMLLNCLIEKKDAFAPLHE